MDADKYSFVPRMFIKSNGELDIMSIDIVNNQFNYNEQNQTLENKNDISKD